ncbi:leucine-rich repeat domain-containing protein [Pararhodobacter zhoushanensis]|uniref:Leucine-rich repeat domain-containing protein n=1 Tax=Pararhodobacter zhoushanensis TaxID=2479545 RepID=A0ABT3GTL6_9RHOB|nr:leucine-rich repeat domain-containing protein [Pararhodobacter zhoushanensis]MCW1930878.1 hypothetical protein [Pararhodobacter zhoushanensis]
MTDAERAYERAKERIAKAKAEGATRLSFESDDMRALAALPPEIAELAGLRFLDLDYTHVSDLTPLSGLTGLTELYLTGTPVGDLTPLSGLTGLTVLSLEDTPVSELTPLSGLTKLSALRLSGTPVSDLTQLSGLTGLTELWLMGTQVSDLTPLSDLTGLTALYLSGTPVSDLTPLSGLTGLTELWLNDTPVSDLAALSVLTGLTELYLADTQVSDLTPLSDLLTLTNLWLDRTPVRDLRPIRRLQGLVESSTGLGLTFDDCMAAKDDPRIAEISEIVDSAERARVLFECLEDWELPGEGDAPQPDALFAVEAADGRLEVAASAPSEAEREESLKRALHRRLQDKSHALADAAGNRFPRLGTRARLLEREVAPEFEDLDMLGLHLAIEDLQDLARLGREEQGGEDFPEEVIVPLGDALRLGPGLVIDNADVALLMDRARRYAENPAPEADKAAQDAMSARTAKDTAAMGERLRALEDLVLSSRTPDAAVAQQSVNKNVLWKLAAGAALWVGEAAGNAAFQGVFGAALTHYVLTSWDVLWPVAQTYGVGFADWFLTAMAQVREFAPLAEEARRKWRPWR